MRLYKVSLRSFHYQQPELCSQRPEAASMLSQEPCCYLEIKWSRGHIHAHNIITSQYRIHLPESKKEKTCGGRGSNTGRLLRKFPKWKGVILTTRLPSLGPETDWGRTDPDYHRSQRKKKDRKIQNGRGLCLGANFNLRLLCAGQPSYQGDYESYLGSCPWHVEYNG